MTPGRRVAAGVAAAVLLVAEAVLLWFGWSGPAESPAFGVGFRWAPLVGIVLGVTLVLAIVRRSARLARVVGVGEVVRAVVVAALMILVGGGDGDSAGLAVLSLVWTTTFQALTAAYLALGVVARQLRPVPPAPR